MKMRERENERERESENERSGMMMRNIRGHANAEGRLRNSAQKFVRL